MANQDENENVNKQFKPDIPDIAKKGIPTVVLPPEVQLERDVRRYIRKDGVLVKDFQHLFDVDTGEQDSVGRIIYKRTMTDEEALKFVIDICEKAGRKVGMDSITGRYKAEPGWNLDIRVPGMSQSEQKAPTVTEASLREKMNQQLILQQQEQLDQMEKSNIELMETVRGMQADAEAKAQADAKATAKAQADAKATAKARAAADAKARTNSGKGPEGPNKNPNKNR